MSFGDPLRGRMRHGLIYLGLPIVHPLWDDPDLVSFLGFEEGSGDKASDAYTWTMVNPEGVLWVPGKVGTALYFSKTPPGSYISTPYSSEFDLQTFSISVWIKVDSDLVGEAWIYSRYWRNAIIYGTGMWLSPSRLYFRVYKGDGKPGTSATVNSLADLRDDTWHHVVATCGGGQIELFVDTISQGTKPWTEPIGYYPNTPVVIGCTSYPVGVYRFKGIIDEFYLFKRALTASEITKLFEV